jgi:hypothetical protein
VTLVAPLRRSVMITAPAAARAARDAPVVVAAQQQIG